MESEDQTPALRTWLRRDHRRSGLDQRSAGDGGLARGDPSESYRIRAGEDLTGEVVRVAEIQHDRAIEIMHDQSRGRHQAIHDARKRFKKLRCLFRLVREAAPDFYASENARIRDMARTLSTVCDATALVETLDYLMGSEREPQMQATLGDDHDLACLETLITTDPGAIGNDEDIALLRTVTASRSSSTSGTPTLEQVFSIWWLTAPHAPNREHAKPPYLPLNQENSLADRDDGKRSRCSQFRDRQRIQRSLCQRVRSPQPA